MKKDWEIYFDKEINENYLRGASSAEQLVGIKDFIRSLLESQRKEIIEKIEKYDCENPKDNPDEQWAKWDFKKYILKAIKNEIPQ